jgi:hypothetical protein
MRRSGVRLLDKGSVLINSCLIFPFLKKLYNSFTTLPISQHFKCMLLKFSH